MKLLITILFISCSFRTILCSKSHPITTLLNAKWSITPVCLEVAEYLFDENPTLFWDYVEALNSLETPLHKIGKLDDLSGGTDKQFYKIKFL